MDEEPFLTEELLKTTYFYCLKRLGRREDAEDVAQEILLTALEAMRKGRVIHHFWSWYWQVAQNCLSRFRKRQAGEAYPLEEYGGWLPSTDPEPEDCLVSLEETANLHSAISRLSALHRDIIVLYYLQECRVEDIAKRLQIPVGTVKRRLFDARKKIRKGMDEMNQTGRAAFAPAELIIWGGFGMPKYWNQVSDIMTKQILVACSGLEEGGRGTGKTQQEIGDAIGVAPLYFEGKLAYLLDNGFLRETSKGRYQTDFCIFPEQAYVNFEAERAEILADIGKEVTDAVMLVETTIRGMDFYGNAFPYSYLMWLLYVYACDVLNTMLLQEYEKRWTGKIPPNNGKDYRIAGRVRLPEEQIVYPSIPSVSWSNLHQNFITPNFREVVYANLFEAEPFGDRDSLLNDRNIPLLMKLYEQPSHQLTEVEQEQAALLVEAGLLVKGDDGLFLTLPVITQTCKAAIYDALRSAVQPLADKYEGPIARLGEEKLLPHLRPNLLEEFVHWAMSGAFFTIDLVMDFGIHQAKTLAIPEDYSRSAAGLCLYVDRSFSK